MASTVYYGKSTTAAGTATKVVVLFNEPNFEMNQLKNGDLLVVHFVNKNAVNGASLSLAIGDSNNEISTSTDIIYNIKNPSSTPVLSGAWADGEVVTFVYMISGTNTAAWVMVDSAKADYDTYGEVKLANVADLSRINIGSDAITVDGVKHLIQNIQGNSLDYDNKIGAGNTLLGTLTLVGEGVEPNPIAIYAPTIPTIDKRLSQYNNDAGFITNAAIAGKIDTAGTGLTKTGTTLSHSNSVNAQTTQGVYPIKIDAQGHISAYGAATHTSIQTYSGTPSINLAFGGKYSISAAGTSYAFSLPAAPIMPTADSFIKRVWVSTDDLAYPSTYARPRFRRHFSADAQTESSNMSYDSSTEVYSGGSTHVYVKCPTQSGYKPIGVIGWNVSDSRHIDGEGSAWTKNHPGNFFLWAIDLQNHTFSGESTAVPSIHFQGTNKADVMNSIHIVFQVLYMQG